MKSDRRRQSAAINSGSMADIAFLLLIFFLLTTTIIENKGLFLVLPPFRELETPVPIHDRNLFTIFINAEGELLVEGKTRSIQGIENEIKEFLMNPSHSQALSESPEEAVVSLKTSRRTSHEDYIEIVDHIFKGYALGRAESIGMDLDTYRLLSASRSPEDKLLISRARKNVPRRLSIVQIK